MAGDYPLTSGRAGSCPCHSDCDGHDIDEQRRSAPVRRRLKTGAGRCGALFSIPYLEAEQGVLARRGLESAPTTLAQLARLRLCTQTNTTAAALIASQVKPVKPPTLFGNTTRLFDALRKGRCDVVIYDAPILATQRAQVPRLYGPLVGVIETNEDYGVVLPTGSPLAAAVNDALAGIISQGTLAAISKRWLSTDLAKLRALR